MPHHSLSAVGWAGCWVGGGRNVFREVLESRKFGGGWVLCQ